jgi:pyridoxal phosphate enzyme (YggS family)
MENPVQEIRRKYELVQEKVELAAQRSGRQSGQIKIVVVSKGQPVEKIKQAIEAGITILGENYPEETEQKIFELGQDSPVEWHMIGHLQSRKAKMVADYFSYFHSLDRLTIARKLQAILKVQHKRMPVLVEVNVGGEPSKMGWDAADPKNLDHLLPEFEELLLNDCLEVQGLMTMPPQFEEPGLARPTFAGLCQVRDFLAGHFSHIDWSQLSMGTSADFEIAIEEGATYIRVGQAVLGPRSDVK